jgi:glutaredoxin
MHERMRAVALTLYGRSECHLCEAMTEIVRPVAAELGCTLAVVDVSGDAELEARFGQEVPVLCINGRKAFKYRLSERDLRKRVRAERRGVEPAGA